MGAGDTDGGQGTQMEGQGTHLEGQGNTREGGAEYAQQQLRDRPGAVLSGQPPSETLD